MHLFVCSLWAAVPTGTSHCFLSPLLSTASALCLLLLDPLLADPHLAHSLLLRLLSIYSLHCLLQRNRCLQNIHFNAICSGFRAVGLFMASAIVCGGALCAQWRILFPRSLSVWYREWLIKIILGQPLPVIKLFLRLFLLSFLNCFIYLGIFETNILPNVRNHFSKHMLCRHYQLL